MKFKNIVALVAPLLLFSAGHLVSAQSQVESANPRAGMQDRGSRTGPDRPQLSLTDDQKAKLKSLHEGVRQQIEVLRSDATLSADEKRAKIRSLRQTTRQQFTAVLNPEQQQLLRNERSGRRQWKGSGEGRGLRADLGLTADQQSQLAAIHQNTKGQMNAIRSDSTLSSEQKEAKLKSLFQNSHQQVSAILTPEQQQKLREGHRRGPGHSGSRGHQRVPGRVGGPVDAQPTKP